MAAVPSIGRATRVERPTTPSADAAGDLYERYSGQIFGYCLHQLGSREEAEDAVQTTFMNAFRGLQRGIVPELESAWLFKIAHNVCLSRRRSSWRRGRIEAPNNFEVLQEVVPGRDHVADELIRLQDVLEDMPENQRRAILLREWQGLTYREISAELELSQAAVETLIFRARRALAQGLEQDAEWKKKVRQGADLGGAIAVIKMMISGGGAAAMKVAASAIAVATASMATASAPAPNRAHSVAPPVSRAKTAPVPSAQAAASAPASSAQRTSERSGLAGRRVLPPAAAPKTSPGAATAAPAEGASVPEEPTAPPPAQTMPAARTAQGPPAQAAPQDGPARPAGDRGRGKGKAKGHDKGKGKGKPGRDPSASADPPPASAPQAATWSEPGPEPQPAPPGQQAKPDKGKPDKPEHGNGHGSGKNK